ncbi:MAG: hypothetical protein LLG40_08510 [Deltaproteobacteria bacterium]|nr:hypothetical protein [Deltaproteobacteria bacterium]
MKKHILAVAALWLCCIVLSGTVNAAGEWTKVKDSKGIKCYERSVPGTDLKEFIGVTTIDAGMEVIGEVLRDVERFPEWITDCASAKIEKKYDRNTFVIYMILNPILIQPRDIVLKNETVYDYENGNARVSFSCTDEVKIPVERKRTRVKVMSGLYKMEYLGRNKTKFIYKLKVDPAGDIPKKIAFSAMKNYPFDTLKKLNKMITDSKYAAAAKGSEDEREINTRAVNENIVRKIFSNNMIRVVKDRALLTEIIAADSENIKSIAASGGSYGAVEKAARDAYFKYIDKIVGDKKTVEKLKGNKKMIAEITDLVTTSCEANNDTIDGIVARYIR